MASVKTDDENHALCRILLPCYVGESPVRIQLEFYAVVGRDVYGALLLDFVMNHYPPCRHELPFATFGTCIRSFVRDLLALHRSLTGKALLSDRDGTTLLGVAYFEHRLAVGGEHLLLNFGQGSGQISIQEDLLDPFYQPVRFVFDGLELDSSYLTSFIRDLDHFLDGQGVDCTDPYPWGPIPAKESP
jgi:hypothetical protein